MKLEDFEAGDRVVYVPNTDAPRQEGTVTSKNERFVFVCYGLPGSTSQATAAELLEHVTGKPSR